MKQCVCSARSLSLSLASVCWLLFHVFTTFFLFAILKQPNCDENRSKGSYCVAILATGLAPNQESFFFSFFWNLRCKLADVMRGYINDGKSSHAFLCHLSYFPFYSKNSDGEPSCNMDANAQSNNDILKRPTPGAPRLCYYIFCLKCFSNFAICSTLR